MLPSLSEQPLNFWLLVAYYTTILITIFFFIKPFVLKLMSCKSGCNESASYHQVFGPNKGFEHCDNCYDHGGFVIFMVLGLVLSTLFFLVINPIMWLVLMSDGKIEKEAMFPLTKSQMIWLWDNGVVFLPVLATLLVWLV